MAYIKTNWKEQDGWTSFDNFEIVGADCDKVFDEFFDAIKYCTSNGIPFPIKLERDYINEGIKAISVDNDDEIEFFDDCDFDDEFDQNEFIENWISEMGFTDVTVMSGPSAKQIAEMWVMAEEGDDDYY